MMHGRRAAQSIASAALLSTTIPLSIQPPTFKIKFANTRENVKLTVKKFAKIQ
jgi:hypothetical protein